MADHYESRIRELEAELRNLTSAVAKASGSTSVLLEAIAERDRELRDLKRLLNAAEDQRPERAFEGLVEFVQNRVSNLRELMQVDVARAKLEFGKHIDEIIMRPEPNGDR